MKCLNCGCENIDVFCSRCGQRHIDAEQFDVVGLAGDYSRHTVGKLTLLRSVWTLLRHPGQLTIDYLGGRRISQINPLVLYLFLWTTLLTLRNLFETPDPAQVYAETQAAMQAMGMPQSEPNAFDRVHVEHLTRFGWIQAWFLVYVDPILRLLVDVALLRLVAARSWLKSLVFALHLHAAWFIIDSPLVLSSMTAEFWTLAPLLAMPLVPLLYVLRLIYFGFAFHRVFGAEIPVWFAVWTFCVVSSVLLVGCGELVVWTVTTFAGMGWIYVAG